MRLFDNVILEDPHKRFNNLQHFENKRKVERMLKQSSNPFKLFRHPLDFVSTCMFQHALLFNKIEWMLIEANVETLCAGLNLIL